MTRAHYLAIWIVVISCSARVAAQGPPRPGALPIFVDYFKFPDDIQGLTREADAVVSVRIASDRFESIADPRIGRSSDVTKYTLTLLDVLKPHSMLPPIPAPLTITRLGGQRVQDGKAIESFQVGFEPFQVGADYVLFLIWNERTDAFDIAYGPHGSYQLLPSGIVRALGTGALAKGQDGKPREAFEREIRSAAGR